MIANCPYLRKLKGKTLKPPKYNNQRYKTPEQQVQVTPKNVKKKQRVVVDGAKPKADQASSSKAPPKVAKPKGGPKAGPKTNQRAKPPADPKVKSQVPPKSVKQRPVKAKHDQIWKPKAAEAPSVSLSTSLAPSTSTVVDEKTPTPHGRWMELPMIDDLGRPEMVKAWVPLQN